MAKSQVRTYVFTPGAALAGTITMPGKYDLSQFLIITNTTRNTILYNFADVTYTGTTVSFSRTSNASYPTLLDHRDGFTTLTLAVSTVSNLSTDQIQIFVEERELVMRPYELGTDAFERQRVAAPKSMLDADFEYGLQPTKWQTVSMMRGYPSVYEVPGTDILVSTVTTDASTLNPGGTGHSLITVTTQSGHGLTAGQPITISGYLNTITGFARAEGTFVINTVPVSPTDITGAPTTFTYYAQAKVGISNGDIISTTYTQLRKAAYYTGSSVGSPVFSYNNGTSPTTVTVTFVGPHGFVPGDTITTTVSTDNGVNNHTLAQGPFFVETVPTLTSLTFTARANGTITGTITGLVYSRPDCFYVHRPFDGGVVLGTSGPSHGAMAVRQSKKYIRYQSGKAVNYNTGALFAPNYDVRAVTSTGTFPGSTITITTDDIDHGCQVGAVIQLIGCTTSGYDGTYTVTGITDERSLTVQAATTLGSTVAGLGAPCYITVRNWYGATVRAGTFDDQNGMFWQYDGQTLAIGRRSSTFQLAGTVTAIPDSNSITGSNTRFTTQLKASDRVVIRGMTHIISQVVSDTQLFVTPDYRGATTVTGVKMVKTVDYIIPQSQWNGDRLDGTNGPFNQSGYLINPTMMQMIGLQWTWYGAGFVDWMLRGPEGKYIFVHRLRGNNLNREAYMRSGNMPVRYEVLNETSNTTTLTADPLIAGTTLSVVDTTFYPPAGTLYVDNEIITYTGKTATSFTGCTRAANFTTFAAGSTRTFSAAAAAAHPVGTSCILIGQTATPSISHWGSAFLSDGGFDEDRGYLFNYQATNISISTQKTTAFAIRLAPSVSNAIIGDLGTRDLINRAQLLLKALAVSAGGSTNVNSAIVIEAILNPSNYPTNLANITWFSLQPSSVSGQPSFSQIALGSTTTFDQSFTLNTTTTGAIVGATTIPVASTSGIRVGDDVFSTSVTNAFAGNTKIISFIANTSITVSSGLITALSATNNIRITRNTYATPGETIFSFINSPNGTDALNLEDLKELTNTPIGGRGTFPNGPDVLFFNVYLTQGTPILCNLILRWGEAQA
jgi:hypothetical protein